MNRRATPNNGHHWTASAPNSRAACRLWTVCEQVGVTEREHEVCQWLMQGRRNTEIAAILGISPRTAEKHVQQLLSKLGVGNRTAAAMKLVRLMRHSEA
jgi:DNA-binding CsgD family transcriptional regulator